MKLGVVLFQLGGPDSLQSIEPFLYNLFCDPDIIDFPFARIARQPLAKLISSTRARHVQHHYAEIGGRSPIRSGFQILTGRFPIVPVTCSNRRNAVPAIGQGS